MVDFSQAPSPCMWSSSHVTLASRERLLTQILKSCAMMKDCTSDLLDVSLLFPSAPWVNIHTIIGPEKEIL